MESIINNIKKGDFRVFNDLLGIHKKEEIYERVPGEMKDYLLHYTAYFDNDIGAFTKHLINEYNFDVNVSNKNGVTPLMYAISQKRIETAKILILDKKLNVNVKDNDKQTYLHYMINAQLYDLAEFFLDKKKDKINLSIKDHKGRNSFFLACDTKTPSLSLLTKLLKRGSDVNSCLNNGITALMQSIIKDNKKSFEFLLKNRADIDYLDDDNESAVHKAVRSDDRDYLSSLLMKAPDLTIRAGEKMLTPLMLSLELNNIVYFRMIDKIKHDKSIVNKDGKDINQIKMSKSYIDMLQLF